MIWAKIGPCFTRNSWLFGSKTMVPIRSAGSRSGVNWMREKLASTISASVLTARVLARPGHAFQQDVAAGEQPDEQPLDHHLLPHDPPADLSHHQLDRAGIHGAGRTGRTCGHGRVALRGE